MWFSPTDFGSPKTLSKEVKHNNLITKPKVLLLNYIVRLNFCAAGFKRFH